eukprot:gene17068-23482_t
MNYLLLTIALLLLHQYFGHTNKRFTSAIKSISATTNNRPLISMKITNGIIIGGGRIGNHLFETNNKQDILLTRKDNIPIDAPEGPIYVCTRNNDLDNIIANTPANRQKDLVFLQNGILTTYLDDKRLSNNTQILIYYAVSKKGEKPIDGVTDLNPGGLTAVTGEWSDDFKARMTAAGLTCNIYDKPTWEIAMLEKHIWICAFMAIGHKHKCTVGEVEKSHNEEIRELIGELATAAAKWRNGWFLDLTFNAVTDSKPDPCPLHTALIASAGNQLMFKARKSWSDKTRERRRKENEEKQRVSNEREEYFSYLVDEKLGDISSPTISKLKERIEKDSSNSN